MIDGIQIFAYLLLTIWWKELLAAAAVIGLGYYLLKHKARAEGAGEKIIVVAIVGIVGFLIAWGMIGGFKLH